MTINPKKLFPMAGRVILKFKKDAQRVGLILLPSTNSQQKSVEAEIVKINPYEPSEHEDLVKGQKVWISQYAGGLQFTFDDIRYMLCQCDDILVTEVAV